MQYVSENIDKFEDSRQFDLFRSEGQGFPSGYLLKPFCDLLTLLPYGCDHG
jgi:hypothetical protein